MSSESLLDVKAFPPEQTLYLVDISSFIFRAYFAIRRLTNKNGEPTNAVYGVATMLAKLIEEVSPSHLLVVYDSKEPSFRKEISQDYKANRSAPPDDLVPQFDRIETLIDKMGIASIRKSGVEADDLIASSTKEWLKSPKTKVVIVSGDKDLMALVDERVRVWDTLNNTVYAESQVKDKFGIDPTQMRDYLALVGDSSDNIPGVPSIGPKSAVQLLTEYKDLESILKAAQNGKILGKKGEVIKNHIEDARLSAKLATLVDDIKTGVDFKNLKYQFQVSLGLKAFLTEMDFHSLLTRWEKGVSKQVQDAPVLSTPIKSLGQFVAIQNEKSFKNLLTRLEQVAEFGFDLETTSLNPREAKIVGIAISLDEKEGFYIPLGHKSDEPQLDEKEVLSRLKPFLENTRFKKVGQNLKYDWSVLYNHKIFPEGLGADTMVAAYVLSPEGRHNLGTLAEQYLSYSVLTYEEVCGKGKDQKSFDDIPIDLATRYSAEDAWIALKLWHTLQPKLQAEGFTEIFARVDLPLVPVLARMECEGICIDEVWLKKIAKEFKDKLKTIEDRVHAFTQKPINLNSPKQLALLLFEELKLPPQSKTKTGYSTDASVLEALSSLHEVPRLLLEYREISKLLGTYVEPLPLMRDKKTGRIHAGFHQTVAATGRLSSSDPNLQNIPVRTERGKKIRRAFIPRQGNVFISVDYSQIELRILAHMSQDPELIKSFQKNEDVHRRTASEIYETTPEQVTEHQREVAKAINFGLMYGKTAFGLAQELKISRKEAQATIDRYFSRYQEVKRFLDRQIIEARERGWTTTLMGRKRKLPDIQAKNPMLRANAERMAMNTPIQGSAADLMKLAMIELDEKLTPYKARMIVQVHDELLVDCPVEEVKEVEKLMVSVMEGAMQLSVPLKVNSSIGQNWAEL